MRKQKITISVIGGSSISSKVEDLAESVGKMIAELGCVLVCGGLGGAMEAAAMGAKKAGGMTIGILPGKDKSDANSYIDISLPTSIGYARNTIVACSADIIVALPGSFGTNSEICYGLVYGRPVIDLGNWNIEGMIDVKNVAEAEEKIKKLIKENLRQELPELPEVETIVRDLNKSLRGKMFSDVIVHDAFVLRQQAKDFIRRLKSQTIENITRRGKAMIVHLSSGEFLVIQLMMTGQLIADGQKDKHTRITFDFSDGSRLLYNDQRRFGQLRVVAHLDEIKHFNILGPEPFSKEFTPALMREAFRKTNRPIKNVLLDHTFVAGIGNIYACEILFRSRLSPKRQARRINLAETKTFIAILLMF